MLEVGATAPVIPVKDDRGDTVSLADFRGQRVVLYFYPKSDTPGCTIEACELRDDFAGFGDLGVTVLGASPDPVGAQAKFRASFSLPFPLLADEDHALADAFGVWGPKTFMGREYVGVSRTTFIVEADGTVGHVFANVVPTGHARQLLDHLRG